MTNRQSYAECKIAAGQSLSTETDLRNHDIVGIEMPAAWTAASISFLSCSRNDGASNAAALTETFLAVVDQAGAEVTVTAAASKYILFNNTVQAQLRGLGRTKIISGTNASPVVQVAQAIVRLILAQELG